MKNEEDAEAGEESSGRGQRRRGSAAESVGSTGSNAAALSHLRAMQARARRRWVCRWQLHKKGALPPYIAVVVCCARWIGLAHFLAFSLLPTFWHHWFFNLKGIQQQDHVCIRPTDIQQGSSHLEVMETNRPTILVHADKRLLVHVYDCFRQLWKWRLEHVLVYIPPVLVCLRRNDANFSIEAPII